MSLFPEKDLPLCRTKKERKKYFNSCCAIETCASGTQFVQSLYETE
jgi:7,8-dihydro-6-hydroxymethylpterin-pyrophosphokinase